MSITIMITTLVTAVIGSYYASIVTTKNTPSLRIKYAMAIPKALK